MVVGLNDVGLEPEVRHQLPRRAREESKALRVVVVTVNIVALEVILVIDKVISNAVVLHAEQSAVLIAPGKPDGDVAHELHSILVQRRGFGI